MERIVLAVDGSEPAMRAARFAGQLSAWTGAEVDIINVVPEHRMVVTDGSVHEYSELEQVNLTQMGLMKSMGQEIVSRARMHVQDAGGKVNALEVMIGSPPHGIVGFAEGVGANCIVMGRRGLGEIRGLFMGSVSHRVGQLTDLTLITTE